MLSTFSTQIVTDLKANAALLALLPENAISALISEQEDGGSWVNYFIKFGPGITKDNATDYQVEIHSWSNTYDKSIAIADQVTNALDNSANYYDYLSAESEPIRMEKIKDTYIVTKQIFNIKQ